MGDETTPRADPLAHCESVTLWPNGRRECCGRGGAAEFVSTKGDTLFLCPAHYWQVQTPNTIWTPVRTDRP
jgi:hypothetical protein